MNAARTPLPAWRRALPGAAVATLVLLLLASLWYWSQQQVGIRRESPRFTALMPVAAPEPVKPPEAKPEPKPEPEVKPVTRPQPRESKPVLAPKPRESASSATASDTSQAMQIDGEAQAGGDVFNIGAGSGGGMSGSGLGSLGNASYGRYLAYALQQAVSRDPATRRLLFRIQVDIWLDAHGRLTRVELVRGSGEEAVDRAVLAALRAAPQIDRPPPASLEFPARVSIQGRRS